MLKKALAVLSIIITVSIVFCSCADEAVSGTVTPTEPEDFELALIAERGKMNDGGYNELSLRGIEKIADVRSLTYKAYPSSEATDESRLAAIDLAVSNGAKVIVTPGYHFETAVYSAQSKYPEVSFIIIDGAPHPEAEYVSREGDIAANTASISFSEEQMGYLAGYAAVMNGSKHIGYMGGMPIEAVRAYGNGFLQGAESAANDIDLTDGAVTVEYSYSDVLNNADNEKKAADIYAAGADVVFACSSAVFKAANKAAKEADSIAVAAEFAYTDKDSAITSSVIKELEGTVYKIINSVYNHSFASAYGGRITRLGASLEAINMVNYNEVFKNFSAAAYGAVYSDLASGIRSPIRDFPVAATNSIATPQEFAEQLGLKKVIVNVK